MKKASMFLQVTKILKIKEEEDKISSLFSTVACRISDIANSISRACWLEKISASKQEI